MITVEAMTDIGKNIRRRRTRSGGRGTTIDSITRVRVAKEGRRSRSERYTTREALKRFLLAAEEARRSKISRQTSEGIRKSKKKSEADRQLHKEAWELGIMGEEEARGWGFIE